MTTLLLWRIVRQRRLLLVRSLRRANLGANSLAGDDHLDAAILLPSRSGRIGCNWRRFAHTGGSQIRRRHALADQVIAHRVGTALGEDLVEVIATHAVGV